MAQIVARLDDGIVIELDALVEQGVVASRSEGLRVALIQYLDRERRAAIGRAIVDGYDRIPETDEENDWARRAAIAMVEEEPW